jgi:hypothetical protein
MRSIAGALFVLCAWQAAAVGQVVTAHYIGTNGNWFNPANWSTGSVPGSKTDVLIDGTSSVVIDPAVGPAMVTIRDLTLAGSAQLETLPGTIFTTRNETLDGTSRLIHRSSEARDVAVGPSKFEIADTATLAGPFLQPTPKSKRDVILKTSATLTFYLGGSIPAAVGSVGAGHYANWTTENMTLAGELDINLIYGFIPTVGQTFQIMSASNSATGTFSNLPEGAIAARFPGVALTISYQGGDGNDVVLTAVESGIPAASAWGLLALSLAVLCAGCVALRARQARTT